MEEALSMFLASSPTTCSLLACSTSALLALALALALGGFRWFPSA